MGAVDDQPAAVPSVFDDGKRVSTAAARAALLAGSLAHGTDDAGRPVYILTRWAYTRHFHDLGEVERVLDIMGADAL
jgi:hypothetical protein